MYNFSYLMEGLTWLGFFAAVFFAFYFYLRFRNKERMALIEKGVDVSEIYKKRDISFRFPWKMIAIMIIGIGTGLFFSYVFVENPPPPFKHSNIADEPEIIITFSLLIFGGIGILVGNLLERTGKKQNG